MERTRNLDRFGEILKVAFGRFGHGFRTKPRRALVFVLRLALGAPRLGVGEDLANLLCFGWVVGVGFWSRLAAVVHAPALGVGNLGSSF
ncbi:hypothetical protein AJGP001_13620 [Planococcus faecalis]|uniref:Uncharacterized protein n=1 Tax=Planococcus faecalis TaxID=1598147 RepID=A0ABN4XKL8_9BACL|nr:hypothetical protein AJGP001_13620 [Planococcus faecalis]OHX55121.1 hypothetical protein BB777_05275 [Planococcus faecalis]